MNSLLKLIVFLNLVFLLELHAQERQVQKLDSITILQNNVKTFQPNYIRQKMSVTDRIKSDLNNLMDRYVNQSNTPETWKKLKSEATNILYSYFKSQQLVGLKPEQAFYVKIGYDTMTAEDIKSGNMILLVGIATVRPAEFEMLRFERMVTGK